MKIQQVNRYQQMPLINQMRAPLGSNIIKTTLRPLNSDINFRGRENTAAPSKISQLKALVSDYKAKAIWNKIQNSDNIVILTHKFADGDAISSGLAMLHTIQEHFPNKKVEFYVPGKYPSFLGGVPGIGKILTEEPDFNKIGLAISVDCSKKNMDGLKLFKKAKSRIKLDHHYTNEFNGPLSLVDKKAPSATSVIYNNFFKPLGLKISPQTAECLLTGLTTDTGNFTFATMGDISHKTRSELLNKYAGKNEFSEESIAQKFDICEFKSRELRDLQGSLMKIAKSNEPIMLPSGKTLNYVMLSDDYLKSFNVPDSITDIKQAMSIVTKRILRGSDCSMLIWDLGDSKYKISLRSSDDIDLSKLVKKFHGGGHPHAGGFTTKGDVNKIFDSVLKAMAKLKF